MEKCEEGSDFWEPVPGTPTTESHVVKGLEPGKKYKFRVRAKNKIGVGEPIETNKAILAKDPYGMWFSESVVGSASAWRRYQCFRF